VKKLKVRYILKYNPPNCLQLSIESENASSVHDFVGEEVSDNYGPVYYFKPRAERQAELSARYWFHCACPACQGDWPLLGTKL
jgi:hypothetical protein